MQQVEKLTKDVKNYETSLADMERKILELKNKIKDSENEYLSLKARATVAKTAKKVNKQLASVDSDSTVAMIEDMKNKINEQECLAQAYGEIATSKTDIDDETNKAIGVNLDVQNTLAQMKQKLLANPEVQNSQDEIEELKKEFDN